jgi:hypothetical protein
MRRRRRKRRRRRIRRVRRHIRQVYGGFYANHTICMRYSSFKSYKHGDGTTY